MRVLTLEDFFAEVFDQKTVCSHHTVRVELDQRAVTKHLTHQGEVTTKRLISLGVGNDRRISTAGHIRNAPHDLIAQRIAAKFQKDISRANHCQNSSTRQTFRNIRLIVNLLPQHQLHFRKLLMHRTAKGIKRIAEFIRFMFFEDTTIMRCQKQYPCAIFPSHAYHFQCLTLFLRAVINTWKNMGMYIRKSCLNTIHPLLITHFFENTRKDTVLYYHSVRKIAIGIFPHNNRRM